MAVRDIVKIQRPLSTNAPKPMVLIYNKDRTVHFMEDFTPELEKVIGDAFKIYAEVELGPGSTMHFIRRVEAQPW